MASSSMPMDKLNVAQIESVYRRYGERSFLSVGLASSVTLGKTGIEPVKRALVITELSLMIVVGGVVGATVVARLPEGAFVILLSFGLAALLFLVTEELLVEAHEVPETPVSTATFFAGFLIFELIGMIS